MVQVDVIWSYAFGATFAASAARQLQKEDKVFDNRYYTHLLLFLSIFFAPSGIYLLWQFPHWETMQVAYRHTDLPAWLIVLFCVTNITQGIIGFWVGNKLIKKNNLYGAHLNWIVSWTLFWSLLVMGWDTTGWQRFLYDATENNGIPWAPGKHMGLEFFTSNVFLTLLVMGFIFWPMIYPPMARWLQQGDPKLSDAPHKVRLRKQVEYIVLLTVGNFSMTLALAIANGLLVFWLRDLTGSVLLGYLIGLPSFWLLAYFLLLKRGRPVYLYAKLLFGKEEATPA